MKVPLWWPLRIALSLLTGGLISHLAGQAEDLRRGARQAADRSLINEELYRRIVETADEGIWLLDPTGNATYVNSRAAEMLGLEPDAILGRPLGGFTYTAAGASALAEALQPVAQGRSTRFDLRLRRNNGTVLWARVSASPVSTENGAKGTLAMLADVTDKVTAEEALRRSESRFRRLSESGMIGVAVLDPDGRATEANDEFLRLVGGDKGDLAAGRLSLTSSTPPEFREQDRRKLLELHETGVCAPFLKEYYGKDAGRSAVLVGATRLEGPGDDGESVGFMLDISARRRAEEAMRFLAEAGEVLGCSLDYDVTLSGVARLAVPRLADLCVIDVLEADDRISRVAAAHADPALEAFAAQLHRRDAAAADSPVAQVLRSGRAIVDSGTMAIGEDEHSRLIKRLGVSSFMVVPLSARGRTFGAISLWAAGSGRKFDAEELALAEELARRAAMAVENARLFAEANQARVEAERADRTKDQFLAALSHELRTPLTPVLIDVTAMLDAPGLPAHVRPVLEITRRNVELEARLIDDLLDVTRISRGKLRLNRTPVDAHALIRQAVEICRGESSASSLRLDLELAATTHHVEGDPARLQQILWNLVKNAVKFTPPGGRVAVRSRNEPGPKLVVEVSDTGIGIEPEVLPRIFDAFEQGDAAVTKQFGGLGLGLAISRSLAQAHGGLLRVASAGRGQGSTFTLELPALAEVPGADTSEPHACSAPNSSAKPVDGAHINEGLRILLAEDNGDTLRILSRLLRSRGHTVSATSGVEDALRTAEADGPFDLVISDIGLPDGSGLELMSRLRAARPTPGIALSGYGTEDDLRKSREAGFDTHLTKPVDFSTLEAAIRRVARA
jgi:PAS domain S-box-containing protein